MEDARLRAVLNSAGAVIVCTDTDFRITDFNTAAERAFGRASRDVIGTPYNELFPPVVRSKVDRDCARILAGEPFDQFEVAVSDGRGTITSLLWDIRCLRTADGQPQGIVAIAQDITARLAGEASLERRKRELRTLTSLQRTLVELSEPALIAGKALDHLQQLVECQGSAIYGFAPDALEPLVLASVGTVPSEPPTTHGADVHGQGDVVLPLVAGGQQVGLFYVSFVPAQELDGPRRVSVVSEVADRVAAALHIARHGSQQQI